MTFPCEQLLRGGAGGVSGSGDFSLCLWVLLARSATGSHRTLLTRGRGAERWPAVLLRDTDCRLEVCFGGAAMGTLCERLTSKEALPVGRCVLALFAHVARYQYSVERLCTSELALVTDKQS